MRYAILSDIHSNLQAFEAVLKECKKLNIGMYLCAGDVVGYGASPRECLDLIRKIKAVTVAGNHDWAVAGRFDFNHFTDDGKKAVIWTRAHITIEDVNFLTNLQLRLRNKDCVLVHGSFNNPENFIYTIDTAHANQSFVVMDARLCFIGHTHVPGIFVYHDGNTILNDAPEIELQADRKYIVNAGSVGQPRDGNPMASFCVFDSESQLIEIRRVAYDITGAQQKIIEAKLPNRLAARLEKGK